MNKIDRIRELVTILNNYRNEYYNNSNSIVSDFEYDTLFDELKALEQETNFILTVSPTQQVGYEVKSELKKIQHNHPMLSLDKTKSVEDVISFIGDREAVIMAKMDGLTCSVKYIDGKFISAETRGNGEIGEDITHCAMTIKNLPLIIDLMGEVIIDGEVIITYDDFNKINDTLPEDQKYKNPRNLASGSIRQLDSSVAAKRNMKFVAWKFIKGSNNNSFIQRWIELVDLGFEVVPILPIHNEEEYHTTEKINYAIKLIKHQTQDEGYPIDGCVIGYDDIAYGESLGATGHHLKSQLAFKFYDELYETKLSDIEWTIGKTGELTPTACFDTVQIDGTDVSKACIHNISIIKKLGLTNHCTVYVYKANAIIPQIDSCEQDGDSLIEIPNVCPCCGAPTKIIKENESEVLICTNSLCKGKLLGKLVHAVSKKALNIDGLSEQTLSWLIDKGWVKNIKDIYHLSEYKLEWEHCCGFGITSVKNILNSIETSRNTSLDKFICALSIPTIGTSASKTISKAFNDDFNAFYYALCNHYDFSELEDFGTITAQNIAKYFAENESEIADLANEIHFIIEEKKEIKSNPFMDKIIVVTGALNNFTRDTINSKIAEIGAKTSSSVSKKTDYLLTNEVSGSSKYKKAMELNIPVITEVQFLEMIEGE